MCLTIEPEGPTHAAAISDLHKLCFPKPNPAHIRGVDLLRQSALPLNELNFVALDDDIGNVVGSIRCWQLRQGVLIGPVMAHPHYRGKEMPELGGMKLGNALIEYSLHHAKRLGHQCAILKAANDKLRGYYNAIGFSAAPGLFLPGPNSAAESLLLMVKRLDPASHLPVGLLIGTPQSADQLAQLEADRRAQLQPASRRRSWTPAFVA